MIHTDFNWKLLFKQHFWVVNLLVLLITAFQLAIISNHFISAWLYALPHPKKSYSTPNYKHKITLGAKESSDQIAYRNIFNSSPLNEEDICQGLNCPDSKKRTKEDIKSDFVTNRVPYRREKCKTSDIDANLRAVMFAQPSDWSIAIFEVNKGKDDRILKEGQTLKRFTIASIQRQRVILENKRGKFECIRLQSRLEKRGNRRNYRNRRSLKRSKRHKTRRKERNISKKGPYQYEINQTYLNRQIRSGKYMRNMRSLPSYKNGRPNGVKVTGFKRNHIFRKMGLRPGDIINSVSSHELKKPTDAVKVFNSLSNKRSFTIELNRRGELITLEYKVK